jgi:carnitine-CoA ligase
MISQPFSRTWQDSVCHHADRPFLTWVPEQGPGRAWSYAAFDKLVATASGVLARAGMGAGDRVHLVHPNGPAFVMTWLAATRLGAIMVAADPRATSPELAAQIDLTEPTVAVVTEANAQVYDRAGELAARKRPLVISCVPAATALGPDGDEAAPADVPPTAPAALMFTSGTTSAPKAVVVTQANYSRAGHIMADAAAVSAESRWIVCLPLFHANAQYYCFAAAISRGAHVCLLPRFSASGFIASARAAAATHASLFAAPIRMILRAAPPDSEPAPLLHCWYAQNLTPPEYAAFARLTSCAPRQLYGMTETMAAVLTNPAASPVADSMGQVTPGCQVRVVAPDGRDAEPGEEGEVVVGGIAGIDISPGYWRNERATHDAFTSEGLRTGDYAHRDAGGFHYFRGRRSDILKVGGENVSTVEIEAALASHPAVREVAVVGEPHDMLDEVPVAYVVLEPGLDEQATISDLTGWSEQSLSPSKRPRAFRTVGQLPRTSVGKIRKVSLRAVAAPDPSPTGGTPA